MKPCACFVTASIVILSTVISGGQTLAEAHRLDSQLVHGTINIVLGNGQGMVVLTDSMLTAGDKQLLEPGQKLFQLDDYSVCAIAGFIAGYGPTPELSVNASAILHEYQNQLAKEPRQTIDVKLTSLAHLIEFRLNQIANLHLATKRLESLDNYRSQITVAGYDNDGMLKFGRIFLTIEKTQNYLDARWDDIDPVTTISSILVSRVGGMPDVADDLLQHPDKIKNDTVFAVYQASLKHDSGASLSVEQMKALAEKLANLTSKEHPEVGGENQIAIFRNGHITDLQQQQFPKPTQSPVNFGLNVGNSVFNGGNGIKAPGLSLNIAAHYTVSSLKLDNNYFVGSIFDSSTLSYNGGITFFDTSNHVNNCSLILGPEADRNREEVDKLVNGFAWKQVIRQEGKGEKH